MNNNRLKKALADHPVPKKFQHEFKHVTDVHLSIRDCETTEESMFNYLAWEYQNQRRPDVMWRMYRRLSRLRTQNFKKGIDNDDFR